MFEEKETTDFTDSNETGICPHEHLRNLSNLG